MADIDGDGRLDVVTGSDDCCDAEPGFYWFRREADGRFSAMPEVLVRFGDEVEMGLFLMKQRMKVALADWDGDGHLDVITQAPNPPGGLFRTRGSWNPDDGAVEAEARVQGEMPAPTSSTQPVVVDWDGDGRLDLIASESESDGVRRLYRVLWYRNEGTPRSPRLGTPRLLVELDHPERLVGLNTADWDSDGWPDLLVASNREKPKDRRDWQPTTRIWVYPRRTTAAPPTTAPDG